MFLPLLTVAFVAVSSVSNTATVFCSVVWTDSTGKPDRNQPPPPPSKLVQDAEVIVLASPRDTVLTTHTSETRALIPESHLTFAIIEVLKGRFTDTLISLPGEVVHEDEYNTHPVPYQWVRSSGGRGSCFTFEYKPKAMYLLLLNRGRDHELTTAWSALMPVNEQVRGRDDPWVRWVRRELDR